MLTRRPANQVQPAGKSQGYKAGVTLAGLIACFIVGAGIVFLIKRRKARRARAAALATPLVVGGMDVDPESQVSGSDSSAGSLAAEKQLATNKAHAG